MGGGVGDGEDSVGVGGLEGRLAMGGHSQDFFGEVVIIGCTVAVGFVFEDGITMAGGFGELDVSSNTGVEDGNIGPRGVEVSLFLEVGLDIGDDFGREGGPGIEHAKEQSCDFELRIDAFLYEPEHFEELTEALEGQKMGLKRDETLSCGTKGI